MNFTISLKSDEEGMFGRECPDTNCERYFKVNLEEYKSYTGDTLFCPYCGVNSSHDKFFTKSQAEYMQSLIFKQISKPLSDALKKMEREPDRHALFSIGIKVDIKEPTVRHYIEKATRRKILYAKCNRTYSVYGVSYYCPYCGTRDPFSLYKENVDTIKKMLNMEEMLKSDSNFMKTGKVRELEEIGVFDTINEKMLDKTVTTFETYCKNRYVDKMIRLNPQSSGEAWLKKAGNSFQNLDRAEQLLTQDLGYSIKSNLSVAEIALINKEFQKRHVVIHNSGIIDEKYIVKANESPSLIGRKITISKKEIMDLLNNLDNLIQKIDTFFNLGV